MSSHHNNMSYPNLSLSQQDRYSRSQAIIRALFGWLYIGIFYGVYWMIIELVSQVMAWIGWWVAMFSGVYIPVFRSFILYSELVKFRFFAYMWGMRDGYPFFQDTEQENLHIDVPNERFSRLKGLLLGFFEWLLLIPHWVILGFVLFAIAPVASWLQFWFVLFSGKQNTLLYQLQESTLRYSYRVGLYAKGVVQTYPPFEI